MSDKILKYDFKSDIPFITFSIVKTIIISSVLCGLCISAYLSRPHLIILFVAGLIIIFPIPLLYARWRLFKYDSKSILSVDIEHRQFTYTHNSMNFAFNSKDITEWNIYEYGTRFTNFLDITELHLKGGEVIRIYGGLGNINYFLKRNKKTLSLPNEHVNYSLKYLCDCIKQTNHT